jgi:3'-phosphoadenosine 5'-phosphosulfate sulfotransferase (PAPS reductase)/FAD synthetase
MEQYGEKIPDYLIPFTDENSPPNESMIIHTSYCKDGRPMKRSNTIRVNFFGNYDGHPFTSNDLTPENFDQVICIHDAVHSAALLLHCIHDKKFSLNYFTKGKIPFDIKRAFCLHTNVPFEFPFTTEYSKYLALGNNLPFITCDWMQPIETLLPTWLVPKMIMGRWCTKKYKILQAKSLFKFFGLDGITQQLGVCKTAKRRKGRFQYRHLSEMSYADPKKCTSKGNRIKFKVFEEFPIFGWNEEYQAEFIEKHGIETSPSMKLATGCHGCMWCPYRPPEYYVLLKEKYPIMFDKCNYWRKIASQNREEEYFWFNTPIFIDGKRKSRGLSKEKMDEHPEWIQIM